MPSGGNVDATHAPGRRRRVGHYANFDVFGNYDGCDGSK